MSDWHSQKLRDFFFHYDFANPDHGKAVDLLQEHASSVMGDNAEWVKIFRGMQESLPDGEMDSYVNIASNIIAEYEGFEHSPYCCPAGVWTIGYGTTYYPDGKVVTSWDPPVSKETAMDYLRHHINHAVVHALGTQIPTWGVMNGNQRAAIISFAYNLGAHFYGSEGFYTISKTLSDVGNFGDVPAALLLYVNPGSTFEHGLRRRRIAEGELWNGRGKFAR